MSRYSDDDIRNCKKITCQSAGNYLGISPMAVSIGMRNDLLPIGFAVKKEERYSESWSYHIIGERLIAYKHGRITSIQVENIDLNSNAIKSEKDDLINILNSGVIIK